MSIIKGYFEVVIGLISGAAAELDVTEGLIWYVLFIIEKRKGDVLLTFVELRYGRHLDLRKKDTAGSFKNAVLKSIF